MDRIGEVDARGHAKQFVNRDAGVTGLGGHLGDVTRQRNVDGAEEVVCDGAADEERRERLAHREARQERRGRDPVEVALVHDAVIANGQEGPRAVRFEHVVEGAVPPTLRRNEGEHRLGGRAPKRGRTGRSVHHASVEVVDGRERRHAVIDDARVDAAATRQAAEGGEGHEGSGSRSGGTDTAPHGRWKRGTNARGRLVDLIAIERRAAFLSRRVAQ